MDCIIGLDGGGTKTLLRAVDMNKNIVCEALGGSTNLCSNSDEMVYNNLKDLFLELGDIHPIAICLGSAGISGKGSKERLNEILFELTNCKSINVVGDMETPLAAEVGSGMGVLIIAGTGAVAFGQDGMGNTARSSGWGHIIGDEGSSYWVAVQGLKAAMKGYDGRGIQTILTNLMADAINVSPNNEIVAEIYKNYSEKSKMASLSNVVNEAAELGDTAAYAILNEAADELLRSIDSVAKRLSIEEKHFPIIISGGLLLNSRILKKLFIEKTYSKFPNAKVKQSSKDPAWGAVELAFELLENHKKG